MPELGKATYVLVIDSKAYSAGLKNAERQARATTSSIAKQYEALAVSGKSSATATSTAWAQSAKAQTAASSATTRAAKSVTAANTEVAAASEGMASRVKGAMASAMGSVAAAEQRIGAIGTRIRSVGSQMSSAGRRIMHGFTVPVLAIGVAAGKMAIDFEDAMLKIQNLVGESKSQVEEWSKQLLTLGPKLGKSPKELADALFFITSAGIHGGAAIDVLTQSAKASSVGLGDTMTVADAVTSAVNAYGAANLSASKSVNVLAATVKEGKTEAASVAPILGRLLPVASQLGVKFNEVGAAIASQTRIGLSAAGAGTALRAVLTTLLHPASQAEKALNKAGLSSAGLRKEIKDKGLLATLHTLADASKGNAATMGKFIPNVRALVGAFALTGKNAKSTNQIFSDMSGKLNIVNPAFKRFQQTASFKVHSSLAALETALIKLGGEILPVVVPAIEKIVSGVGKLVAWIGKLPAPVRAGIVAFIAFVAVLGPLLMGLGAIVTAIGAIAAAFGVTAAAILPWIAGIAAAIVGIVALTVLVIRHWNEVKAVFSTVLNAISSAMRATVGAISVGVNAVVGEVSKWKLAGTVLRTSWNIVFGFFKASFSGIRSVVTAAFSVMASVIKAFISLANPLIKGWLAGVKTLFTTVWSGIQTILKGALQVLRGVLLTFTGLMRGDWSRAWNGIKTIFTGAWNVMKGFLTTLTAPFRAAANAVGTAIKTGLSDGVKGVVGFVKSILNAIIGVVNLFINEFDSIAGPHHLGVSVFGHHIGVTTPGVHINTIQPLATGGTVTSPLQLVGEQGPELVRLPKGSQVHSASATTRMLAHAASSWGPTPAGQTLSPATIVGLWLKHNGSRLYAKLMEKVSWNESNNFTGAHNASGASGLWQILGQLVGGDIYNPDVNAENAVAKFKSGGGLNPWTASKNEGAHGGWGKWMFLIGQDPGSLANINLRSRKRHPKLKPAPILHFKQLPGFPHPIWPGTFTRLTNRLTEYQKQYDNLASTFEFDSDLPIPDQVAHTNQLIGFQQSQIGPTITLMQTAATFAVRELKNAITMVQKIIRHIKAEITKQRKLITDETKKLAGAKAGSQEAKNLRSSISQRKNRIKTLRDFIKNDALTRISAWRSKRNELHDDLTLYSSSTSVPQLFFDMNQTINELKHHITDLTSSSSPPSTNDSGNPPLPSIPQTVVDFKQATAGLGLDVPGLASGGVLDKPTLFLGGEGGEREIVSPESMMRAIVREEGAGSGLTIEQHNHMLHPADPEVLIAIGRAATAGHSYQGGRPAKRFRSGL